MLLHVLADLGHRVANIRVRLEQVVMFLRLPFGEGRQFLRDRLEQADNNPNWSGLHVLAKLLHRSGILDRVSPQHCSLREANLQEPGNGSRIASLPTRLARLKLG